MKNNRGPSAGGDIGRALAEGLKHVFFSLLWFICRGLETAFRVVGDLCERVIGR